MSQRALSPFVHTSVTSHVGRNATLPCWTHQHHQPRVVEWTRRDSSRQYVCLQRDGHLDPGNQSRSYRRRAELKHRETKDGDLSLNLRDVQPSDAGTYECRYTGGDEGREGARRKRSVLREKPACVVSLTVDRVQYITARPGHTVILPCRVSQDAAVDAVEWTRSDLESDGYVFLLRDGIPDTTRQNPRFENRVELSDGELKDGNLSLVVKSVRPGDSGRYECRLKESEVRRHKRSAIKSDPVSIIQLMVTDMDLINTGDTEDEDEPEDEDDTDSKGERKPGVTPTSGAVPQDAAAMLCGIGCWLLYAFIWLWAFV